MYVVDECWMLVSQFGSGGTSESMISHTESKTWRR